MTNRFEALALPGIQSLQPYQPGKPVDALERELGLTNIIKLASNENPLGPSPLVSQAIQQQIGEQSRYPDGSGYRLKNALSEKFGVTTEQISLGCGSSELLELIARIFVAPEHEVLYSRHAFAMYPLITQAIGARSVTAPALPVALGCGHDLDAMRDLVTDQTRLIFVANPNNPTGSYLSAEKLELFIASLPTEVICVVDEAYFEYFTALRSNECPDTIGWLDRYPNLIVTRTFSKAYGLAGLRIGYSISNSEIAGLINRIRQPFNVNALALCAAEAALGDEAYLNRSVELNRAGLKQLTTALQTSGIDYLPSVANFVTLDVGQPAVPVYQALLREGVIVRPVANYGLSNHLRVTVGSEMENDLFLTALQKVLISPCKDE